MSSPVDISTWREASSLIVAAKCSTTSKDEPDYKLLLTKRSGKSSFLANAFCFPGGHIELADFAANWWTLFQKHGHSKEAIKSLTSGIAAARPPLFTEPLIMKDIKERDTLLPPDIALRLSALRETFEETGILISTGQCQSDKVDLKLWQKRVHDDASNFHEMFVQLGSCPDIWSLTEWWNWLTPAAPGHKRFDTMFYLCCLDQIPTVTGDDNEVSLMEWHTAQHVLELHSEAEAFLAPPQVYELARLANFTNFEGLKTFAKNREKLGIERWCAQITGLLDGAVLALPGDDMFGVNMGSAASQLPTLQEARAQSKTMNRMELRPPVLTPICANVSLPCGHLLPVTLPLQEEETESPPLRSRLGLINGSGRGKPASSATAPMTSGTSMSLSVAPGYTSQSSDNNVETSNKISLPSCTLKRNPKMELSRSDLLRLLSALEGELQAREVVIAVLKAEQIKKLLYPSLPRIRDSSKNLSNASTIVQKQRNTEQFNANDPYSALLRDSCAAFDPSFDEASTKSVFRMQVQHLNALMDKQHRTRGFLTNQLDEVTSKYNSAFTELEKERRKNIEFDRDTSLKRISEVENENGSLTRDNDALKEELEKEREREKQMITCLLTERKQLIVKLIEEKHKNAELVQMLGTEKSKISEMVEGLEEESKRSLQMELDLERLGFEYESQNDILKEKLLIAETRNLELETEVERLQLEIEQNKSARPTDIGDGVRSTIVTASMANSKLIATVPSVAISHPKPVVARPISPSKSVTVADSSSPFQLARSTSVPLSKVEPKQGPAMSLSQSSGSPAKLLSKSASEDLPVGGIPSMKAVSTKVDLKTNSPVAETIKRLSTGSQSGVPRGAPPPVPPNKPVLPPQILKERSKELQQAIIRTKVNPPSTSSADTVAKQPVQIDEKSGEKPFTSGHANGQESADELDQSVDLICKELDDFQKLLVSMVSDKSS
ncbi:Nucleoside diphosphate-linked moiety X motif 19 [Halotydeus destructor]|nr:Nucleoside diphosphate-linked moiety X motif 19 [Halotydeus destructor]